ncbi:HEPN domain-containing protein [Luteimonas sp. e5]
MQLLMDTQALMFHAAYERCLVESNGVPNVCTSINEEVLPLALPAYVCAAFAAEIGLKALLRREGIVARGHDLQKLFSQLPIRLQNEIRCQAAPYVDDFDSDLDKAKDTFQELRYVFEYTGPPKHVNFRVVVAISAAATKLIGLDPSAAT